MEESEDVSQSSTSVCRIFVGTEKCKIYDTFLPFLCTHILWSENITPKQYFWCENQSLKLLMEKKREREREREREKTRLEQRKKKTRRKKNEKSSSAWFWQEFREIILGKSQ